MEQLEKIFIRAFTHDFFDNLIVPRGTIEENYTNLTLVVPRGTIPRAIFESLPLSRLANEFAMTGADKSANTYIHSAVNPQIH